MNNFRITRQSIKAFNLSFKLLIKEYIIKEFEDLLYLEKLRVLILTKELLELPIKIEDLKH